MVCNWLMMTSSGEDNWPWEFGSGHRQKKKPKAEQETAQPTAARFKKPKAEQEPRSAHGRAVN